MRPPKFKKGDKVKTPSGTEWIIDSVHHAFNSIPAKPNGKYFYGLQRDMNGSLSLGIAKENELELIK